MTTCSNYEKQLSTMSDHLCELNDKMMQKSEELEHFKKGTKASFLTSLLDKKSLEFSIM